MLPLDKGKGRFQIAVVALSVSVPFIIIFSEIPLIVAIADKRTEPDWIPKTPFGENLIIVTTIRRLLLKKTCET